MNMKPHTVLIKAGVNFKWPLKVSSSDTNWYNQKFISASWLPLSTKPLPPFSHAPEREKQQLIAVRTGRHFG